MRLEPSYMIIGGVKCASSSLYRYLNSHPLVLPCKVKEPSFFNEKNIIKLLVKYPRYKRLFPDISRKVVQADWVELTKEDEIDHQSFIKRIETNSHYLTGEASATYAVRANPKHVKRFYPKMKIIYVLRDPTERFISHFDMFKRFEAAGNENLKIGSLIDFTREEMNAHLNGKPTKALDHGLYIKHIDLWNKHFNGNIFLLKDHDLSESTGNQKLNDLCNWLGLPEHDFTEILKTKFNSAKNRTVNEDCSNQLDEFYKPYNEKLRSEHSICF